ncbi:MAG: terminase small subunit [Bacteroidetes bacterium]|nr:MAG: terminase small subunit [Bacteroidota bacterium]
MAREGLTIKQEKYAQNLFKGMTQREAYKDAYNAEGMSDKCIDEEACILAANPKVSQRIEKLTNDLQLRNMVTIENVVSEYAKLGFFDPRKLFNEDGRPKDITELDDETAAALAGLDVQEVYEGTGEDRRFIGYTKKYKLTDKKAALDSMAKYLGMFTDKSEVTGNVTVNFEQSLLDMIKRKEDK